MKMNISNYIKRLVLVALPVVGMTVSSCGNNGDDELELGYKNPADMFQPAVSDTSAEASLRRDFYSTNGIYLLFNDTLQHEYLGTDINGDQKYFTETIDMTYNVGQTSSTEVTYKYSYLTSISDKQKMVDFTNNYLLNHLTKKLRPYSIFICRVIVGNNSGTVLRPYAMSNERCVAIASSYITLTSRTEAQKQSYARTVINSIIGQLAQNNSSSFANFYSYSSRYYGANFSDYGITGTTEELRQLGFISSANSGSFPSQATDLNSYVSMAMQYTEDQFNAKYAGYDVILNKFAEVRRVLVSLGYVF